MLIRSDHATLPIQSTLSILVQSGSVASLFCKRPKFAFFNAFAQTQKNAPRRHVKITFSALATMNFSVLQTQKSKIMQFLLKENTAQNGLLCGSKYYFNMISGAC